MSLFTQFTGSSTLNYPQNINESVIPIDILIVGGGGSGGISASNGSIAGAGGGGGEVIDIRGLPVSTGNSFSIIVGSGGNANYPGSDGGDSIVTFNDAINGFKEHIARGGGKGGNTNGSINLTPNPGGSGGGGLSRNLQNHISPFTYGEVSGGGPSNISFILNEKGSLTSYGEFKNGGGDGVRSPYNTTRFAAGGGGGGASPGEDGVIIGTNHNGGAGGSGYYYNLVPYWDFTNKTPRYYGPGGGGYYGTNGAGVNSTEGGTQLDLANLDGEGGIGIFSATLDNVGRRGVVMISYPASYGPPSASTGFQLSDGTEAGAPRPSYRVIVFQFSGSITF